MEDAEQMLGMYSDPEVMKFWSCPPITDIEGVREFTGKDVESDARGDSLNWAITLDAGSQVIGKCILFHHDRVNRRAEVGYILSREHWKKGLMTEAMAALIDYAFGELGLHRLEADTDPANSGSLRMLEKLGFRNEGLFRDRWFVDGVWQDSEMLGLLKPDWESS